MKKGFWKKNCELIWWYILLVFVIGLVLGIIVGSSVKFTGYSLAPPDTGYNSIGDIPIKGGDITVPDPGDQAGSKVIDPITPDPGDQAGSKVIDPITVVASFVETFFRNIFSNSENADDETSKNKDTSLASEKSFNPFTAAANFFKGLFGGDDNSDAVDEPVPEKEVIVEDSNEDNNNQGLLAALKNFFQDIFS